jgi:DNA helicase-2/ATP-dependent DNA helicase PcrA
MHDPFSGANDVQRDLLEMPIEPVLLLAPPGCGKTEALALRAAGLVSTGRVVAPRKILALTFSNKARDGLRKRLRERLGSRKAAHAVTVQNFHGFAARVVNGHGHLIGAGHDVTLPDRRWVKTQLELLSANRSDAAGALAIIRQAKQKLQTDDAVAIEIANSKNMLAQELETRRLGEGRLDFDDLIRAALLLLQNDGVRRLYRAHFAAVLVDEMQDMTLQQLELSLAVGAERMTLAGDTGQGIYGFAGADPDGVVARFEQEDPTLLLLTENYRSAPAILKLVSAMAKSIGGEEVTCAEVESWSTEGHIRVLRYRSTEEEAASVLAAMRHGTSGVAV